MNLRPQQIASFRKVVYTHYRTHGRDLPWRRTKNPYRILVSEVMLQQTQVPRVLDKYKEFVKAFPTIRSLAQAPLRDVVAVWSGLGYNRRALALKRLAETVVRDHNAKIPRDVDTLKSLPGIGPACAGAIATFAFGEPNAFIETNIRTVFIHHFFKQRNEVHDKEILPLVEQTLDKKDPRGWYYALMDYGVALKSEHGNAGRRSAQYTKQSRFEGSNRQVRGRILRALLSVKSLPETALAESVGSSPAKVRRILKELEKEGFIRRSKTSWSLRS